MEDHSFFLLSPCTDNGWGQAEEDSPHDLGGKEQDMVQRGSCRGCLEGDMPGHLEGGPACGRSQRILPGTCTPKSVQWSVNNIITCTRQLE